ncbi:MAG: ImmA/IrrE family metallo-endopeptidase [Dehalogenimonas sp.]
MTAPLSLSNLCDYILDYEEGRYAGKPAHLGAVFREYAGIERTPSLTETIELMRSFGINIEPVGYLKSGGTSMKANGSWYIHYSASDKPATQKYTIFHELFEIIQQNIGDLDSGYVVMSEPRLSQYADRFAAVALIPPRFFLDRASATGFDLVALGEDLELSHQCLLIAIGQHFADVPLVGALYEYLPESENGTSPEIKEFKATVVTKTPPARGIRTLCWLQTVPSRNSRPRTGSLVCAAVKGGKSLLWKSTYTDESPLVLVRPLLSAKQEPYRVILLAVPGDEFGLISSQVEGVDPIPVSAEISCPSASSCPIADECVWNSIGGYDEF